MTINATNTSQQHQAGACCQQGTTYLQASILLILPSQGPQEGCLACNQHQQTSSPGAIPQQRGQGAVKIRCSWSGRVCCSES